MLGDRLTTECADRFTRLLDVMPRLSLGRYRSRRHLTIVHGDAHVRNALYPNDGTGSVTIIDWASWRIDAATRDLAYMLALHWYPERRARLEQPLLRHYHAELVRHGVRGYDFDALLDDYRLSALRQLVIPVWQATAKLPVAVWWGHRERGMRAFEDLGCAALRE
jgi:aminoglycoside phosphotransferase (APT) family kinase protein